MDDSVLTTIAIALVFFFAKGCSGPSLGTQVAGKLAPVLSLTTTNTKKLAKLTDDIYRSVEANLKRKGTVGAAGGQGNWVDMVNAAGTATMAYTMLRSDHSSQLNNNQQEATIPRNATLKIANKGSERSGFVVLATVSQEGQTEPFLAFKSTKLIGVGEDRVQIKVSSKTADFITSNNVVILFVDEMGNWQDDIELTLNLQS